ncbi:MAG: hypothetical protein KDD58_05390 [Bdellovibrionales bacterium]|nr:hypothetical protein [Bdellovibrionales bacterium]
MLLKEINDSQFNMWRAIVALVHADGHKHSDEDRFLKETFAKLPFSDQQLEILSEDMSQVKKVDDFYPQISDPGDRSQFIYFARLLFWSDGDFHHQEEAILQSFRQQTLDKANLQEVMKSVDAIAEDFAKQENERGFRQKLADFVGRFFE